MPILFILCAILYKFGCNLLLNFFSCSSLFLLLSQETQKLQEYIKAEPNPDNPNWANIEEKFGGKRTAKQIRERWSNHINPLSTYHILLVIFYVMYYNNNE